MNGRQNTDKNRKLLWWLAFLLAVLTLAVTAYSLVPYFVGLSKTKNDFHELEALIQPQVTSMQSEIPVSVQPQSSDESQSEPRPLVILPQYEALHEQHPDVFGWLTVESLNIDYPVMYTPDRPQFYLNRDIYGGYSDFGVPFLQEDCFYGCGNYIVHGHRMNNGSIFGSLHKYEDAGFREKHPYILFDTLYDEGVYEIIAVVHSRIFNSNEEGYRCYEHPDLTCEEDFDAYVEWAKENALYDTGVEAEYGDMLLSLSTCSYHAADGRLVIVAKKISQPRE